MKKFTFAALLFLSLASVGQAVTLELTFDQPTFNTNTTGSFRLYGSFGIWGPGSSSSGGETTSYIFDGSFRGTSTATPPSDFYFWLESYSATGTLQYGGSTYPILSEGRAMWLSFSPNYGNARPYFQVFVAPTPTGEGSSGPVVDMTGTFTASKSGGAGMTFADMSGDYSPHTTHKERYSRLPQPLRFPNQARQRWRSPPSPAAAGTCAAVVGRRTGFSLSVLP